MTYSEQAEKETSQYMTQLEGSGQKGYVLQIMRKSDNSRIDISTLVGDITLTTSLQDSPGKLTFFIQRDPNKILDTVQNGDLITFDYYRSDGVGVGIFRGYVFNIGMDATEVFKITAYDQTRYLKNEVYMQVKNMTVSQVFEKICVENQINYRIITPIDYVPPKKIYYGKTLYSILRECIRGAENDSWSKSGGKNSVKYMIRDNYGTLELRGIETLKTNVIIGQESLLSSYQFETSIDKGTYNSFLLLKKVNVAGEKKKGNEPAQNYNIYQQKDSKSIKVWGLLQKAVEVDENMNKAQLQEYAANLLRSYCRETKTLSLSALGVMGMNAGVGFKFAVPSLGANLDMYILEATHRFSDSFHTMDLTVNANDIEVYFK